MTSQVVQGMGILMGRYGHLTGKIMGLKIHPSKVVEFLYLLSHWELAAHITDRTKLLENPLSPKSDQHQISPYDISTQSGERVMRIIKMIT